MGLRLTNLKDLRDSNESGLKRVSFILVLYVTLSFTVIQFWGSTKSTKAAGKMIAEDDDSDTDDELGLWEVDPQGEPVTPSRQIPTEANHASAGPSTMLALAPETPPKAIDAETEQASCLKGVRPTGST